VSFALSHLLYHAVKSVAITLPADDTAVTISETVFGWDGEATRFKATHCALGAMESITLVIRNIELEQVYLILSFNFAIWEAYLVTYRRCSL